MSEDLDKLRKEIRQELIDELLLDIKPGDTLYMIRTVPVWETCPHCNGRARLDVMDGDTKLTIVCPYCQNGLAQLNNDYQIFSQRVTSVVITIYDGARGYKLESEGVEWSTNVSNNRCALASNNGRFAYRTRADAEAAVERLKAHEESKI
jgi:hypothetical protein